MEGPTPEHKETEAGRSSVGSMEDSGGSLPRPLYEYEMRTINHYQQQRATELLRDEQISTSMKAREQEYVEYSKLSVFCGTWNVNGKRPRDESLSTWLFRSTATSALPDVYVIGLQEMVDLNATNVMVSGQSNKRAGYWKQLIEATLNSHPKAMEGKGSQYVNAVCKNLVGLLLCVFVKRSVAPACRDVAAASAGIGIMGFVGNKGAVAARLQIHDSTLCFVSSHLAAHRGNIVGRNAHFQAILGKVEFKMGDVDGGFRRTRILDHHIVLWLGDLNYRIAETVPLPQVLKLACSDQYKELLKFDQLKLEREAGRVFHSFHEGAITFRPTYKFQPGTNEYDQRPEKKVRAPAWCDRVLWRMKDGAQPAVRPVAYTSIDEYCESDHKPVVALLEVTVRRVIEEKRREVLRDIVKQVGEWERDNIPQAAISKDILTFPMVQFKKPEIQYFHLTNTGKSNLRFHFVPKPGEGVVSAAWAAVRPLKGAIRPGETEHFAVAIWADHCVTHQRSLGRTLLDEIMVLRIIGGRDFFISVSAKIAPTCFGASLRQMVGRSAPFRALTDGADAAVDDSKEQMDEQSSDTAQIPKELWRLVDFIMKRGLTDRGLLLTPGNPDEVELVRHAIDTNQPIPHSVTAPAVAEVLLEWLATLGEPVIPQDLFPLEGFQHAGAAAWASYIVTRLSTLRFNVLMYIVSFARHCLLPKHAEKNGLQAPVLAVVLAGVLMKPPASACRPSVRATECAAAAAAKAVASIDDARAGAVESSEVMEEDLLGLSGGATEPLSKNGGGTPTVTKAPDIAEAVQLALSQHAQRYEALPGGCSALQNVMTWIPDRQQLESASQLMLHFLVANSF